MAAAWRGKGQRIAPPLSKTKTFQFSANVTENDSQAHSTDRNRRYTVYVCLGLFVTET